MSDSKKHHQPLNVVLYWHMHQPEYRDLRNGEYHLPWTYLHTIKDYVDMAAHIEQNPAAKAVVNFAPVLLEQIEDYARQLDGYLNHGHALRDHLLAALVDPVMSNDSEKRINITKACLRANRERLVNRNDAFRILVELAETALDKPEMLAYCSDQFFVDLLVWYHIAWMAETVRKSDVRINSLINKGQHYTVHDRHLMLEVIHELVSNVIGRYRALMEQGQIELSMTPYAHPIIPLLISFESASEAIPDVSLPLASEYPDGSNRAQWHIEKGIRVFEKYFGVKPAGCWPSEGSISNATVKLLSEAGVSWIASGESVLRNSLESSGFEAGKCLHMPCQLNDLTPALFFRDDGLSDLIGFKYSNWHADDAVNNLVHHLEQIAKQCSDNDNAIVSIILDGENAWEYYPQNGFHFLQGLYRALGENEKINLTTYSEYLKNSQDRRQLSNIVAGSWVYGTFSTWIGEKDKNRAWDMLVDAKHTYDSVVKQNTLSEEELYKAKMQLATCESSDWFWWFGDYNSAESVAAFDEQFRMHLGNLYQLLKVEPPEYLASAFSFGSGEPAMGGTMLPGKHQ